MAKAGAPVSKPAGGEVVPLRPARRCPICGKPAVRAAYPFCSKRCANIDLNRWFSGAYAISAVEEEPGADSAEGGGEE
jgi:endogenous inhibitor of DNA gyrase (YacG/DUF329 family)